jgi:hypothetical protein
MFFGKQIQRALEEGVKARAQMYSCHKGQCCWNWGCRRGTGPWTHAWVLEAFGGEGGRQARGELGDCAVSLPLSTTPSSRQTQIVPVDSFTLPSISCAYLLGLPKLWDLHKLVITRKFSIKCKERKKKQVNLFFLLTALLIKMDVCAGTAEPWKAICLRWVTDR